MTAGIDTDGNDNDNDGESDEVLVHIVLTGASGYLGQHLLAHWITDGIPVSPKINTEINTNTEIKIKITALYHRSDSFPAAVEEFCARHEKNINKNGITDVAVRSIDLTDPKQIGEFVSSSFSSSSPSSLSPSQSTQSAQSAPSSALVTIVVHSAALSSPGLCQKDPDRAGAVNVPAGFFEAVLAAESPTTAIVALSTDQVYDGKPKAKQTSRPKPKQGEATAGTASFLYTESETDGLNPVNVYGRTKLDLERCLSELLQRRQKQKQQTQSSVSCFALRSSIILGPAAPIDPACAHGTFFGFCDDRGKNAQPTTFFTNEYRSVVRVDRVLDAIGGIVRRAVLAGVGGGGDNDNENDDNDNKNEADVGVVVYNMGGPCRVNRMDMARAVFDRFGYDKSLLLPALQTSPQSPLDISMDSSRLVDDGILDDGQGQTQGQTPTPENYLKELVDYVFGAREN